MEITILNSLMALHKHNKRILHLMKQLLHKLNNCHHKDHMFLILPISNNNSYPKVLATYSKMYSIKETFKNLKIEDILILCKIN